VVQKIGLELHFDHSRNGLFYSSVILAWLPVFQPVVKLMVFKPVCSLGLQL